MGGNWLASGGTYWLLGLIWLIGTVFFVGMAIALGKTYGSPNDGCLLAIGNAIGVATGIGIALQLGRYPTYVILAAALGWGIPAAATYAWARTTKPSP